MTEKSVMTTMTHMIRAGYWSMLLTTLLLVNSGCPQGPTIPLGDRSWADCFGGPEPASPWLDPHGQGRDLLGLGFASPRATNPDEAASYVRVDRFDVARVTDPSGTALTDVRVQSLSLVGSIPYAGIAKPVTGGQWEGKLLRGKFRCSNPSAAVKELDIRLRIASATQWPTVQSIGGPSTPPDSSSWLYRLELEISVGTGSQWMNACRDSNDVAFPIAGYWNEAGDYVRDQSLFSFACVKRDVAKCLRAGYQSDANQLDAGRGLFEACTRMMRADYCGDGQSYTKDGTEITLWDTQGIASMVHKEPLVFEAAWTAKGMVCFDHVRWPISDSKRPGCLMSTGNRCDTAEAARQAFPEPLVFNESCKMPPCVQSAPAPLSSTASSGAPR